MNFKTLAAGIFVGVLLSLGFVYTRRSRAGLISPLVEEVSDEENAQSHENNQENSETNTEKPENSENPTGELTVESLIASINETPGTYGLYIKDLKTLEEYKLNEETQFFGASLYKILIAGAVYEAIDEDNLSMSYIYTYNADDYTDGTGLIQSQPVGSTYSVAELLDYLLKTSDNIAQNILVRNITQEKIDQFYQAHSPSDGTFSVNGYTDPREFSEILENIYKSNSLSRELKRDFFERMTNTHFEDRISRDLDDKLIFSHKIGSAPNLGSWHDCGMVFRSGFSDPTIACIMSKDTTFENLMYASGLVAEFLNTRYK